MAKDLVEDFYTQHHEGGSGFRRYGFTYGGEAREQWFRSRIGTGIRILDVGCRDGTLTSKYLVGNEIYGVDVDAKALSVAQEKHGINTSHANLNTGPLPFENEFFDLVVAGEVLEHLQFPGLVVLEIRRVMRAGGLFLGSVPNSFRLKNRLKFLAGVDFETDPTHLHHFSPTTLRELLSEFVDVEISFVSGRKRWMHPRLMASEMVWSSRKV